MSTDYGLKCLDCNKSIVPENLGSYAINDVLKAVSALADLKRAVIAVSVGTLQVEVSAYWCPESFDDLLDFAAEHHQHELVIVDEYGREGPP